MAGFGSLLAGGDFRIRELVTAGYSIQSVPLVRSTLSPALEPAETLGPLAVGADIAGSASETGLIAFFKGSLGHVSFGSFHRYSSYADTPDRSRPQ